MGRELAAAIGRWAALEDHPVQPRLEAVCDPSPRGARVVRPRRERARSTTTGGELLEDPELDVLYLAVPHHLHEELYLEAIAAGKDFLGEKPFGIDLAAARRIVAALDGSDVFARCSSEMPYFPGAQLAYETIRSGALGGADRGRARVPALQRPRPRQADQLEAPGALLRRAGRDGRPRHARAAPAAAARLAAAARPRDDLRTSSASAPGPTASPSPCDTWDNATLHADAGFPLTLATKRIAPGRDATRGGCGRSAWTAASSSPPPTRRRSGASPSATAASSGSALETGSQSAFATITGPIFEFGFSDAILQMWAAYLAEREGALGDRLGCVTPQEALTAHEIFAAALGSGASGAVGDFPGIMSRPSVHGPGCARSLRRIGSCWSGGADEQEVPRPIALRVAWAGLWSSSSPTSPWPSASADGRARCLLQLGLHRPRPRRGGAARAARLHGRGPRGPWLALAVERGDVRDRRADLRARLLRGA